MAEHNKKGNKGEKIATGYLVNKGYQILATNWHFNKLEADIIAKKDNLIVVVEVKTRSGTEFGTPQEAVNLKKQTHLVKTAHAFINQRNLENEVRFDIISIVLNDQNQIKSLEHIEDAFYPIVNR